MVEENWCILHLLSLVVHFLSLSQITVSRFLSGGLDVRLAKTLAAFLQETLFPILDFHTMILKVGSIHCLHWIDPTSLNGLEFLDIHVSAGICASPATVVLHPKLWGGDLGAVQSGNS